MDMFGHINCELSDNDVSEVTEDCLSNADQTIVNRHMNRMLQLAFQLVLFEIPYDAKF